MSRPSPVLDLIGQLQMWGVPFFLRFQPSLRQRRTSPLRLLTALAQSDQARLRLALIPLFLQHPKLSSFAPKAAARLDPAARLTLQCYYTAALWLAKQNALEIDLPDFFSADLGLTPTPDPTENLRQLAARQAELSGMRLNWLGTYQHAFRIWSQGRKLQQE